MTTETNPAAEKTPEYVKVQLDYKQLTLLLGMTQLYSQLYLKSIDERIAKAQSRDEEKEIVYSGVTFYQAASNLAEVLQAALSEGIYKANSGDVNPLDVILLPPEIKFMTTVLNEGSLKGAEKAVESGKFTQTDVDNAKRLVGQILVAFSAGTPMTAEQLKEETEALKQKNAGTAPAELPGALFTQVKTGLA